ncbi:MAG: Ldh family oxidoreductase [Chloroflexi bacterium]|nr:Ldh family oxidoreductase [Chloroflexota bacterium]MDA1240198.1 Ldh family oxidoreductase [Chloroflexota bacterium]
MPAIPAQALEGYVARIFVAAGSPEAEAHAVAEHLVGANLRGHDSHGVIRVPVYLALVRSGGLTPGGPTTVLRESASTAVIDGGMNLGPVVAIRAMDIAIQKARETGVAFVSCVRTGHIGRVGAYGEQAVAAGMGAMGGVNSPGARLTAAFGGGHRRTGTNPLMIALPGDDPSRPFVLDMATSVIAEGKLKVAVNRGTPVPPGDIIDGDGNPSTDARDFYGTGDNPKPGALLPVGGPVGGYKGFGLNLAIELLSGALSGAGTAVGGPRGTNGVWFIAFDLGRFSAPAEWREAYAALAAHVQEPPYAPGVEEVLIAGEPERRRMAERLASGIPLDDETWRQIAETAESFGVTPLAAD